MTHTWQKDLSFSERLAETSKMHVSVPVALQQRWIGGNHGKFLYQSSADNALNSSAAYNAADPQCTADEASKYAKASEQSARKSAASLQDYHERCASAVAHLRQSASPSTRQASADEPFLSVPIQIDAPATGVGIGRYVNAQRFANGLFSDIFKAVLPHTDDSSQMKTVVALKMTTPSMMTPPHDAEREARILLSCQADRIIPLLDTFRQPRGRFIMVFPFMPFDLDKMLQSRHLTDQVGRSILRDLFTGLVHLHELGIIHRDIKPSNILLYSPEGPACIADFGIAWAPSDSATEPAAEKLTDVGTTCYRPPELLFGNNAYTTSLDLWAAGCVAAQVVCLRGRTLFDAGDLGSELALIKSIFETLGTPDLTVWPEAVKFPDWGKMNFREYPGKCWDHILPGVEANALDLISKLITYESALRLRAQDALDQPYLRST